MAERVDAALLDVEGRLPAGFPGRVWAPIAKGMRRHATLCLRVAATGSADSVK